MPDKLREFLKSLSRDDSEILWGWLDSYPDAIDDMIAIVATQADSLLMLDR